MKVSLGLPTYNVDLAHEFGSAPAIAAVARAAEVAGFDACFSDDHPIPGEDAFAFGSHHSYDLLVVLSMVAAATERLRLHTNLLILPFRNPFLSAKGIATLDACSGGRVICGVGVGYGAAELRDAGVTYLAVTLPGQTLDEFTDQVAWFGAEVLPEVEKL